MPQWTSGSESLCGAWITLWCPCGLGLFHSGVCTQAMGQDHERHYLTTVNSIFNQGRTPLRRESIGFLDSVAHYQCFFLSFSRFLLLAFLHSTQMRLLSVSFRIQFHPGLPNCPTIWLMIDKSTSFEVRLLLTYWGGYPMKGIVLNRPDRYLHRSVCSAVPLSSLHLWSVSSMCNRVTLKLNWWGGLGDMLPW